MPAEAVFVRPVFAAPFYERFGPVDNALLLVRMNPAIARLNPRLDLLGTVAQQGFDGFVPPDMVCLQVPVPDHIVGCASDQLKALLDPAVILLGADALKGIAAMISQRLQGLQILRAIRL